MAIYRLNLLVTAVFLLALLLSLFGLIRQGEKDIAREIGASIHFAEQMIEAVERDPARLQPLLNGDTRHIRFYLDKLPVVESEHEVPAWFSELLQPDGALSGKPWRYPLVNGQMLYVQAEPADEIDEVWESALALLLLFLGGALLSNLAIIWGVRQGLKPIDQLLERLEQQPAGKFRTRLQQYSLPEANRLARHFNKMADALEQERHGNQQLTRQLMELQESERIRVAHTLHDDLGQYLTGIRAQAFVISQAKTQVDVVGESAERIISHCDEMQQSFRHLIRDLHPVILEQLGLADALRNLVDQWQESSGVHCRLKLPDQLPALSSDATSHLYRLIQEALHNVTRHSGATEVALTLVCNGSELKLQLTDNGSGLKPQSRPGIGMRSMHERARYLGSLLQLESVAGGGTTISLDIPLESL